MFSYSDSSLTLLLVWLGPPAAAGQQQTLAFFVLQGSHVYHKSLQHNYNINKRLQKKLGSINLGLPLCLQNDSVTYSHNRTAVRKHKSCHNCACLVHRLGGSWDETTCISCTCKGILITSGLTNICCVNSAQSHNQSINACIHSLYLCGGTKGTVLTNSTAKMLSVLYE